MPARSQDILFRIIYPPLSSSILKMIGIAVSGCHEISASRGLTLLVYGSFFLLVIGSAYLLSFHSLFRQSSLHLKSLQAVELLLLTLMMPPTLFGLSRMNTSMLLVPVTMYMFASAYSRSMVPVFFCFALLPFIKPFFFIPGFLFSTLYFQAI